MSKTSNASIFRRHAAAERAMLDLAMPWTPEQHIDLTPRVAQERREVVVVKNVGTARLVRRVAVAQREEV